VYGHGLETFEVEDARHVAETDIPFHVSRSNFIDFLLPTTLASDGFIK
jgi:hypothetical protein